jgi:hypothetical protein
VVEGVVAVEELPRQVVHLPDCSVGYHSQS